MTIHNRRGKTREAKTRQHNLGFEGEGETVTSNVSPPDEAEIARRVEHIVDLVVSDEKTERCQNLITELAQRMGNFDAAAGRVLDRLKNRLGGSASRAA